MPNQTQLRKIVYSDGLHFDISGDKGVTWKDVGAYTGDVVFTLNSDRVQVQTSNAGKTNASDRNMTLAMAPAALQSWDPLVIEAIMAGIFNLTAIAGTPVVGAVQTILNEIVEGQFYALEGQNATGLKQNITAIVDKNALAITDYEQVRSESGFWGVTFGAAVAADAEPEITYDYTPAAEYKITAGTSSKELEPIQVRYRHYTNLALGEYDFEIICTRVNPDPGSFVMTKRGAESTDLDSWTIALTADIDTDLTDGEQLFAMSFPA